MCANGGEGLLVANRLQHVRHLDGPDGCFLTLVAGVWARASHGLLDVFHREDRKADGDSGVDLDAGDFIRKYEDVQNFDIFGSTNFAYVYINEVYPDEIPYDPSYIAIANIDIEVGSDNGFPEPALATEPITAITFKVKGHSYVIGCGDYTNSREDVSYSKCKDEHQLIQKFLVQVLL